MSAIEIVFREDPNVLTLKPRNLSENGTSSDLRDPHRRGPLDWGFRSQLAVETIPTRAEKSSVLR